MGTARGQAQGVSLGRGGGPAPDPFLAFVDADADRVESRHDADDGIELHEVRGKPVVTRRVRLDRPSWQAHRTVPVEIDGLAPCLPHFGGNLTAA